MQTNKRNIMRFSTVYYLRNDLMLETECEADPQFIPLYESLQQASPYVRQEALTRYFEENNLLPGEWPEDVELCCLPKEVLDNLDELHHNYWKGIHRKQLAERLGLSDPSDR